uniref:Uncharacterized protein n=1 Tax=Peronospora matthiolae TaxID=2874970 RepID=A0AAV1TAS9_9STRA
MEMEEEKRRSPNYRGEACIPESLFDRVTLALRGDLEHERDRRLQLADTILKHRDEFAFAHLENERALTSLRDELRVARGIVDRSRDEITALQTLVDAHHREHKALCEMLERKGVLHRKKQRTDGTSQADQHKTWDAFASYVAVRSCMRCLGDAIHEMGRCTWVEAYCYPS